MSFSFTEIEKRRLYKIIDTYDHKEYGCGWSTEQDCAEVGDLDSLGWLKEIDFGFSFCIPATAVRNGHLDMVKWLAANDSSWNEYAFKFAQEYGTQEVKDWLLGQTCPLE